MKRRMSKEKRAVSGYEIYPRDLRSSPAAAPTQPASAPTTRLRDMSSANANVVSPLALRRGTRSADCTPERDLERKSTITRQKDYSPNTLQRRQAPKSVQVEPKVQENVRLHLTQPKSPRSSLRTGSPVPTTPPGSVSLSQSNSSTAPILPSFGELYPRTPRNKLVKRSSSQRVLNGGSNLQSTLRRPATSHQRSATLNRECLGSEEATSTAFHPSPVSHHLPDERQANDISSPPWRPFFRRQPQRASKATSLGKKKPYPAVAKRESPPTVVPDLTELPTLLLATSSASSPSGADADRRSAIHSQQSRP